MTGLQADVPEEEPAADVPDWLDRIKTGQLPPLDDLEEETPAADDDWSASLQQAAPGDAESAAESAAETVDDAFPDLPGDPGAEIGQVPSWLADMESDSGQKAPPVMTTGSLLDDIEELPSATVFTNEIDEDDFDLDLDLPDWLSDAAAEEEKERQRQQQLRAEQQEAELDEPEIPATLAGEAAASVADEVDLAPAELPSWLQAMRPTDGSGDTGQLGKASGQEETIGPLAGLRNVLPAEPDIVHFGKPPTPVAALMISDAQRGHIQILEELIEMEAAARPVARRLVALPQQVMRWVIAALLYLAVLAPLFFESQDVAFPLLSSAPPEMQAVQELVNTLHQQQPGAPVLLAFDYQPAFAAEMQAAGASLIDHLILNKHPLVLVSTKPTGPGLADYFLRSTQNQHAYVVDQEYINFGYISGGTAGLANLATDLRGSFPLQNPDGGSVWDQPPLSGVFSARDFGMLIVLTDNPDTARSWVEQVQPSLVDPANPALPTPLVLVVSAQAEALVYPYYDNSPRQVAGVLAGLAGGANYENWTSNANVARQYWDGYSAGLTATFLILSVAGLYNLVRGLLARRNQRSGK